MLGESFHVHVTESFTCTTALAGTKRRPVKLTAADVGGAAAVAVKVRAGSEAISGVAVMVWGLVDPMLSVVPATPLPSVVLCRGLTAPPPAVTAQVTTTPGTARLFASSALTRSSTGSGLLKYQLCASPPFLTSCVGGPGGSLPPPPPPPHAAAKRPTSTTPRPVSARLTGTGTAGRESPRPRSPWCAR